mmetsp:Transcript_163032/g.297339  ORF Transcript_163032/g.297339 Transcript_163032/m.297339 type:complete len:166 (-) Transcript_163032:562-1059(-)
MLSTSCTDCRACRWRCSYCCWERTFSTDVGLSTAVKAVCSVQFSLVGRTLGVRCWPPELPSLNVAPMRPVPPQCRTGDGVAATGVAMTAEILLGDPREEALGDPAGELPKPLSVLAVRGSADDLHGRLTSATTAELRRRVMIADSCSSNEHGRALASSQMLCCVI